MVKKSLCWSCANATSALRCQWTIGVERDDWVVERHGNRLCVKSCYGYQCNWVRASIVEISKICGVSSKTVFRWNDAKIVDALKNCGFRAKLCSRHGKNRRVIYIRKSS